MPVLGGLSGPTEPWLLPSLNATHSPENGLLPSASWCAPPWIGSSSGGCLRPARKGFWEQILERCKRSCGHPSACPTPQRGAVCCCCCCTWSSRGSSPRQNSSKPTPARLGLPPPRLCLPPTCRLASVRNLRGGAAALQTESAGHGAAAGHPRGGRADLLLLPPRPRPVAQCKSWAGLPGQAYPQSSQREAWDLAPPTPITWASWQPAWAWGRGARPRGRAQLVPLGWEHTPSAALGLR